MATLDKKNLEETVYSLFSKVLAQCVQHLTNKYTLNKISRYV
jgi:hypothetical protein